MLLASLGDGLGQAANDLLPGSPFLKMLNARPRVRGGVSHSCRGFRLHSAGGSRSARSTGEGDPRADRLAAAWRG